MASSHAATRREAPNGERLSGLFTESNNFQADAPDPTGARLCETHAALRIDECDSRVNEIDAPFNEVEPRINEVGGRPNNVDGGAAEVDGRAFEVERLFSEPRRMPLSTQYDEAGGARSSEVERPRKSKKGGDS